MTFPLLASGANPLGHVLDKSSAFSDIFGTDVKLSVVSLVVGAVIVLAWLFVAASRIKTGPESQGHDRWITKGRGAQVVEVLVEGLYSQMLEPVMGARLARAWLPFLLSLFFFVLVLNLMGMVPMMDVQEILHGLGPKHTEAEGAAAKVCGHEPDGAPGAAAARRLDAGQGPLDRRRRQFGGPDDGAHRQPPIASSGCRGSSGRGSATSSSIAPDATATATATSCGTGTNLPVRPGTMPSAIARPRRTSGAISAARACRSSSW